MIIGIDLGTQITGLTFMNYVGSDSVSLKFNQYSDLKLRVNEIIKLIKSRGVKNNDCIIAIEDSIHSNIKNIKTYEVIQRFSAMVEFAIYKEFNIQVAYISPLHARKILGIADLPPYEGIHYKGIKEIKKKALQYYYNETRSKIILTKNNKIDKSNYDKADSFIIAKYTQRIIQEKE